MRQDDLDTKLRRARLLAKVAHRGQVDKAGKNYYRAHLRTVSDRAAVYGKEYAIVGVLHDTLEDTWVTKSLLRLLFGRDIAEAVALLTHKDDNLSYHDYVRHVRDSHNDLAIKVKMTDLKNNMDLTRLDHVTEKDLKRKEKYEKALNILLGKEK